MSETAIHFTRSYLRFFLDFEARRPISLSHKPPTKTNRTRIVLESVCRITDRTTDRTTTYVLSAACKTEQVGADAGQLWLQPNADCIFILGETGEFAIHKSWARNNPGVMLEPPSLGEQPERQTFQVDENFDDCGYELSEVPATRLTSYEQVTAAILGTQPLVAQLEYSDREYVVSVEYPVKTINLCERDGLFQTDTGPILVPDLRPERIEGERHFVGVFDLAYAAFHAEDWAEVVLRKPTRVSQDTTVNHYSEPRLLQPARNALFSLPGPD